MTAASGLSYDAIRRYAERVGEHYGIYVEGPADIDLLVRKLGGKVEIADSGEALSVEREGDFTIYVPQTTSLRRDRFTVAHELGHYFLHYLLPKKTEKASYGRGDRNRAETEANVFASSLLMPEEAFKQAHAELGPNMRALAARFDVSPAAADVRCQVLRLQRA